MLSARFPGKLYPAMDKVQAVFCPILVKTSVSTFCIIIWSEPWAELVQPSEKRGQWHLVRIEPGCLKATIITTIIPARRNCQLIFQHGTGAVSKGLCFHGPCQSASPTQPALVQVTPSSSSSPWLRCWCSCASLSWMARPVPGTAHLEVWREMTEDGRAHMDFTFPFVVPSVINRCCFTGSSRDYRFAL